MLHDLIREDEVEPPVELKAHDVAADEVHIALLVPRRRVIQKLLANVHRPDRVAALGEQQGKSPLRTADVQNLQPPLPFREE